MSLNRSVEIQTPSIARIASIHLSTPPLGVTAELNVAVEWALIGDSSSVLEGCRPFFGEDSKALSKACRQNFGVRRPLLGALHRALRQVRELGVAPCNLR